MQETTRNGTDRIKFQTNYRQKEHECQISATKEKEKKNIKRICKVSQEKN